MLKCAYNPKTTTTNNNIGDCNSGNFWPLLHPDAAAADNDDDDIMVIRMIVINDSNKEHKYCHNNNPDDKKLKTVLNHKNLLKLKFRTKWIQK